MSTETKLRNMTPGQTVTIPTEFSGTHTGVLVRFDPRGPKAGPNAVIAVLRDEDGDEKRLCASTDYTGWVWVREPEFEVRTIWEGQLVASTDCDTEQAAWDDFHSATLDDDGYTVQIVHDGRILAEQINPDENGEI